MPARTQKLADDPATPFRLVIHYLNDVWRPDVMPYHTALAINLLASFVATIECDCEAEYPSVQGHRRSVINMRRTTAHHALLTLVLGLLPPHCMGAHQQQAAHHGTQKLVKALKASLAASRQGK